MKRKISIIHPSRSRVSLAMATVDRWRSSAHNIENIEYILSIDTSDEDRDKYLEVFTHQGVVVVSDNTTAIRAINNGVKYTTGDIFVVVSDDFDCPQDWDKLLLDMLDGKEDFVVKTEDGCQSWIITLPIMDRTYYNRFGYIYPPHILHMFADTWMTHVADLVDRKITLPMKFQHNHYTQKGGQHKDAINEKNDATWTQGENAYLDGVRTDFGLKDFTGKLDCGPLHLNWLRAKGVEL